MSIAELYEKYRGAEWWPKFFTKGCGDQFWFGNDLRPAPEAAIEALIFAALHHHCRAKGWNPDWVHAIPNLHSTTEGMRIYMSGDTDLARLIDAAEKANLL